MDQIFTRGLFDLNTTSIKQYNPSQYTIQIDENTGLVHNGYIFVNALCKIYPNEYMILSVNN